MSNIIRTFESPFPSRKSNPEIDGRMAQDINAHDNEIAERRANRWKSKADELAERQRTVRRRLAITGLALVGAPLAYIGVDYINGVPIEQRGIPTHVEKVGEDGSDGAGTGLSHIINRELEEQGITPEEAGNPERARYNLKQLNEANKNDVTPLRPNQSVIVPDDITELYRKR